MPSIWQLASAPNRNHGWAVELLEIMSLSCHLGFIARQKWTFPMESIVPMRRYFLMRSGSCFLVNRDNCQDSYRCEPTFCCRMSRVWDRATEGWLTWVRFFPSRPSSQNIGRLWVVLTEVIWYGHAHQLKRELPFVKAVLELRESKRNLPCWWVGPLTPNNGSWMLEIGIILDFFPAIPASDPLRTCVLKQ